MRGELYPPASEVVEALGLAFRSDFGVFPIERQQVPYWPFMRVEVPRCTIPSLDLIYSVHVMNDMNGGLTP